MSAALALSSETALPEITQRAGRWDLVQNPVLTGFTDRTLLSEMELAGNIFACAPLAMQGPKVAFRDIAPLRDLMIVGDSTPGDFSSPERLTALRSLSMQSLAAVSALNRLVSDPAPRNPSALAGLSAFQNLNMLQLFPVEPLLNGLITGSFTLPDLDTSATALDDLAWIAPKRLIPLPEYEQYAVADWDGQGSEAITGETLSWARHLFESLPTKFGAPDAAPGLDGTIGLEWLFERGPTAKLFLDIGPGPHWCAYWKRRNGDFGRQEGSAADRSLGANLNALFEMLSK